MSFHIAFPTRFLYFFSGRLHLSENEWGKSNFVKKKIYELRIWILSKNISVALITHHEVKSKNWWLEPEFTAALSQQ